MNHYKVKNAHMKNIVKVKESSKEVGANGLTKIMSHMID